MKFDIAYDEQALRDLEELRPFDRRRRVMDAVDEVLTTGAGVTSKKQKLLRLAGGLGIWQLRVGDFRVLFDMVGADAAAGKKAEVTVRRVLKKGRRET